MPKTSIQLLEEQIHQHNIYYWIDDEPQITDQEYDKLCNQLKLLDPKNKILKRIVPANLGKKIKHTRPMLSLQKAYTLDEVKKWLLDMQRAGAGTVHIQAKFDGVSSRIVNTSEGKRLTTRGDGIVGEDITDRMSYICLYRDYGEKNLKDLESIFTRSIDGELCIANSDFENIKDNYSNPRNALQVLKSKNLYEIFNVKIKFVPHNIFNITQNIATLLKNMNSFETIVQSFEKTRTCEGFNIDGLVLKIEEKDIQENLGNTSHHPRWALAFKFSNPVAKTTYISTTWQVGRSGVITPVANVLPVSINGYEIRRVTLHNLDIFMRLQPQQGHDVIIERAGDVIPKIVSINGKTSTDEIKLDLNFIKQLQVPECCPDCGQNTVIDNSGSVTVLQCNNQACGAQLLQSLNHFAATMEIEDLSEKRIDEMISLGLVKTWVDFYHLTKEDLLKLPGFKDKLADKILHNIQKTKHCEPAKLIAALGIPLVGKNVAKLLMKKYKIQEIVDMFETPQGAEMLVTEDAQRIEGVGPETAASFADGCWKHHENLKAFLGIGASFVSGAKQSSAVLAGKSFCITGTLSKPRKYFEDLIESNGGELKSVSKGLSYLLCGEDAGSKLDKAKGLGITILDENTFTSMLEQS